MATASPVIRVEKDPATLVTTARIEAALDHSLEELAVLSDPLSWSSSPMFAEASKVLRVDDEYVRDPHPPRSGTGWCGHLFENTRWAVPGFVVSQFINILNIDYRVDSDHIGLNYSLHRALEGRVWFSPARMGVDVDSGYLRATRHGTGTRVEVVKRVRFVELDAAPGEGARGWSSGMLNAAAPAALEQWFGILLSGWRQARPPRHDHEGQRPVRRPPSRAWTSASGTVGFATATMAPM